MSDPVVVELIRNVGSFVTAVSVVIIGFWVRRLEKNTNSIKDELVKVTAKSSKAEGKLEAKAEFEADRIREAQTND